MSFQLEFSERGLKQTQKNLRQLDRIAINILFDVVTDFMEDFVFQVTEYPEETERNRPRLNPPYYYERRVGVIYNSGRIRFSSQQLEDKWKGKTRKAGNEVIGTASTDVSYAPYVQTEAKQARHHALAGWRTVESILNEMVPELGLPSGTRMSVSAFGKSKDYFIDATNRIVAFLETGKE